MPVRRDARGCGRTCVYTQYAFTNASEDLHALVTWLAAALGLHPARPHPKTTFFRRRSDVSMLDLFAGPKD